MDSITVELRNSGIAARSLEGVGDDAAMWDAAAQNRADFVVSVAYSVADKVVSLQAAWYDAGAKKLTYQSSDSGTLDLSFDKTVARLIDGIVASQRESITALPPAEAAAEPLPANSAPTAAQQTASLPHIAFYLGSAPFIPVFKASQYITQPGLSASFAGEYRFSLTGGMIGLGAETGVSFFTAAKTSTGSAIIIPIGLTMAYRTWTRTFLDFSLHISGGPAIFLFTPEAAATTTGVVPYLTGGVGLTLPFLPNLVADIDLSYVSIFVEDVIMGFRPSISLVARF